MTSLNDGPPRKNKSKKNMAEGKAGFFSKTVQKHAGRAKERILQNLGKADKTRDELFDEYLNNFNRQQNAATKLHKEIKHYMACIKEMQTANKSLFETLNNVYDPDWFGHEQILLRSSHIDMVWSDYYHKLSDQIIVPLQTYLNQFPEMKEKVGKRGRKLVDYDRQRHNYEAFQNNPKKKDDVKIVKSKEQLDDAKKMYEILNSELHDELPALYDSRIPFMVSSLQTMFTAETVVHNEVSKVYAQLGSMMEKLALENQKGTYMMKKPDSPQQKRSGHERTYEEIDLNKDKPDASPMITNGEAVSETLSSPSKTLDAPGTPNNTSVSTHESSSLHENTESLPTSPEPATNLNANDDKVDMSNENPNAADASEENKVDVNIKSDVSSKPVSNEVPRKVEELYDIPVGATTTDLPPGVLYRVKATYRYECEDDDELAFEPGEIIQVVEYDEEEEQEDGWLMGVREQTGQKGLFPANFTRPI